MSPSKADGAEWNIACRLRFIIFDELEMQVAKTSKKTDPELWEKVKEDVTAGDKGGRPGQWSARKAQMAVQDYKKEGGGYVGPKSEDNSLVKWTDEDWGTKSGAKSTETGERYLPKDAREALSPAEYAETTTKKRRDTAKGRQFSSQPDAIAKKTAAYRDGLPPKEELIREARGLGIKGRSAMTKNELSLAIASARAIHEKPTQGKR